MANWKTWAFVAALAAGGYYAVNYFAGGIGYSFKRLKWQGFQGLKIRLALIYTLSNQNNTSATVSALRGKLYYGTYRLNDISIDQPVTIPPGGTEEMTVLFTINPGQILNEIQNWLDKKAGGLQKFRLSGTLTGKIGVVPFVYPINEQIELAE